MQNTDFSSKEQQIAGKAAPDWKTKKNPKKKPKKILKKYTLLKIYRFTEFTFARAQQNLPLYRFTSGEIYRFTKFTIARRAFSP